MSIAVVPVWTPHWTFLASSTVEILMSLSPLTSTPCWLSKYGSVKSTTFFRSSVIELCANARSKSVTVPATMASKLSLRTVRLFRPKACCRALAMQYS